jgi:DNA-binding IclR family transcriptional regulator
MFCIEMNMNLHDEAVIAALRRLAAKGCVEASAEQIAKEAKVSPRTVYRVTTDLDRLGFLQREGGRGRRSVRYFINDENSQ